MGPCTPLAGHRKRFHGDQGVLPPSRSVQGARAGNPRPTGRIVHGGSLRFQARQLSRRRRWRAGLRCPTGGRFFFFFFFFFNRRGHDPGDSPSGPGPGRFRIGGGARGREEDQVAQRPLRRRRDTRRSSKRGKASDSADSKDASRSEEPVAITSRTWSASKRIRATPGRTSGGPHRQHPHGDPGPGRCPLNPIA